MTTKRERPSGSPAAGSGSDGVDAPRPPSLEQDQTAAAGDQTAADADQTAADADQTLSDADQTLSDADQGAADRDQAAADRDRERHASGDVAFRRVYERSRADRADSGEQRQRGSLTRVRTTLERAEMGAHRDQAARLRDQAADARDLAAEARDRMAEAFARSLMVDDPDAARAWRAAAAARAEAAADRASAAEDREHAARDRDHALAALKRSHLDELTGFYRRGVGEVMLQHEIDRARRSDGRMILAFVDADGLKAVNDSQGHAEGDRLIRALAEAIRSRLRSYDPVVRYGGDEFVLTLSGTEMNAAERCLDDVAGALRTRRPGASFSVGFASLRPDDSLPDLIARGDADLRQRKAS